MNCVSDDVNKGKTFLLEANLWMLALQAARENHEQNVELIADEFGMPFLRVVKTIKQGDVLFLWYNESLARCVGVPILTPANIRGECGLNKHFRYFFALWHKLQCSIRFFFNELKCFPM